MTNTLGEFDVAIYRPGAPAEVVHAEGIRVGLGTHGGVIVRFGSENAANMPVVDVHLPTTALGPLLAELEV